MRRGNATTSWTRGMREVEWEAMAQREERPCNSDERGLSKRKMQQPWAGEAMEGGSHRVAG